MIDSSARGAPGRTEDDVALQLCDEGRPYTPVLALWQSDGSLAWRGMAEGRGVQRRSPSAGERFGLVREPCGGYLSEAAVGRTTPCLAAQSCSSLGTIYVCTSGPWRRRPVSVTGSLCHSDQCSLIE